MPFTPALTAGEYVKLRNAANTTPHYAAAQFASLVPNTNVLATTISAVGATASIAQVTCTAAPGASVRKGQTVLISETNDRRAAYFRGYVRKAPAGNVLYINQTSKDIDVGDYIWVIDDYDLFPKKAREDAGGTYYKDYDEAFHVPNPILYNLQSAYAGWVDGAGNLTLEFAPEAILTNPDAAAISTWSWEVDDGVFVVGNAASQDVTVAFPDGFRWVHLTATDDQARSQTFHIAVWAHHPTDYPPMLGFTGAEIDGDIDSGWSVTTNAFDEMEDVLNRTGICIWSQEYYNGTEGHLYGETGAVEFYGRLRKEDNRGRSDLTYAWLNESGVTIEGVGEQMAALDVQPLALIQDATPAVWDELETLTVWRAICHLLDTHSTFCTIHSLDFDSTSDDFQMDPIGTEDGSLLSAVNALGAKINAAFEMAPDGQCAVNRSARYLAQAARDLLTTLAAFEERDCQEVNLEIEHIALVGSVEGDGGFYSSLADDVTPFLSIAPGMAQDDPEGTDMLRGQVLVHNQAAASAQSELNFRTGQHLAASNSTTRLVITGLSGYHPFVPSRAALYTWTLDDSLTGVRGVCYDTDDDWLLTNVTHSHNHEQGTKEVELVFELLEPEAPSGQTVQYPTSTEIGSPIAAIPPFDVYWNFPALPEIYLPSGWGAGDMPFFANYRKSLYLPRDGNTALLWTASEVFLSVNYLHAEPEYLNIASDVSGVIKHCLFDDTDADGKRAYLLVYNSTDDVSNVYRTSDISAYPAEWTAGDDIDEEWDYMRLTSTPGTLYVCRRYNGAGGGETETTYTFDADTEVWYGEPTLYPADGADHGCWWAAGPVGEGTLYANGSYAGTNRDYINATLNFGVDKTVTKVEVRFRTTVSAGQGSKVNDIRLFANGYVDRNDFLVRDIYTGAPTTYVTHTWSGEQAGVRFVNTSCNYNYHHYIDWIKVTVTVGVAGDSAETRYSTDYGDTFAVSVGVGASPDVLGGDTIKVGDRILMAQDAKVRIAQAGGAYGDEANGGVAGASPALIVVPYWEFDGAAKNINDASPEYLLGTDTSVAGESLWQVTDGGKAAITPSSAGTDALFQAPHTGTFCWHDAGKFAVIGDISGTLHLFTTPDAGANWTDRGAVGDDSDYIRMRKGDTSGLQLYIADGTNGPTYSGDFGANLTTKNFPSENPVIGIEPYG